VQIGLSFLRANTHTADLRDAVLCAFLSSYITTMNPTQNLTPTCCTMLVICCLMLRHVSGLSDGHLQGDGKFFNIHSLCFSLCDRNSTYMIKIILMKSKYHYYWNQFVVKIEYKIILISSWCNLFCPNIYFSIFHQIK